MKGPISSDEQRFYRDLVALYLKHGSVERVFSECCDNIPVSYPEYHRILDKWGIVKNIGRKNSTFSEVITFFSKLVLEDLSVEKLYKKMPYDFETSLATIYRIYGLIKRGITRRCATALIISPQDCHELVMVGNDVSTPRLEIGKPFGSLTYPTTFSDKSDNYQQSVLRVLQQEVFTKMSVSKRFPYEILDQVKKPFAFVDIVDVRVSLHRLILPYNLSQIENFTSYKLKDQRYIHINQLIEPINNLYTRQGMFEMSTAYNDKVLGSKKSKKIASIRYLSHLNQKVAAFAQSA